MWQGLGARAFALTLGLFLFSVHAKDCITSDIQCKHFFSHPFLSLSTLKNERHCYTLRHCNNAFLGDCFKAKKNHCHCWQWLLLIALWLVYFAVSLSWIATTSRPTSRAFWRSVTLSSISMKRTLWFAASPSCER